MEPITHHPHPNINERAGAIDDALTQIRESLRGLRFGSVNVIVQDGVVIQIDRTEKRRLRVERNTTADQVFQPDMTKRSSQTK